MPFGIIEDNLWIAPFIQIEHLDLFEPNSICQSDVLMISWDVWRVGLIGIIYLLYVFAYLICGPVALMVCGFWNLGYLDLFAFQIQINIHQIVVMALNFIAEPVCNLINLLIVFTIFLFQTLSWHLLLFYFCEK